MSIWNGDEVAAFIESKWKTVKLCIAGHDHPAGYINRGKIHYCTIEAMLEADVGNSFAYLEVYEHEIILKGVGTCKSRKLRTSDYGKFTGIANFGDVLSGISL